MPIRRCGRFSSPGIPPDAGNPRPALDAVFVASDTMALGAWQAIEDVGWRVPQDIALMSFDGLAQSHEARPTLSTMAQPIRDLGREAISALMHCIADPGHDPEQCFLPSRLIPRGSCGCAGDPIQIAPTYGWQQ